MFDCFGVFFWIEGLGADDLGELERILRGKKKEGEREVEREKIEKKHRKDRKREKRGKKADKEKTER